MTKRYTVISVPTKDGPTYRIYDRINQCSIDGGFDTQKWAEAVAEMMEDKWNGKNKSDSKAHGRAVRARHKHKQHSEESAEDSGRADRDGEGNG